MFADEGFGGLLELPVGFFVVGGGHAGKVWRFGEGSDGFAVSAYLGGAVGRHGGGSGGDGGGGVVPEGVRPRRVSTAAKVLVEGFWARQRDVVSGETSKRDKSAAAD